MPSTKGTTKIFLLLTCLVAIGVQIEKAVKDDGKISGLKEYSRISFSAITNLPEIVEVFPEAMEEGKDLSVGEVTDLVEKVSDLPEFKEFTTAKVAQWVKVGLDGVAVIANAYQLATNKPVENVIHGNVLFALASLQKENAFV